MPSQETAIEETEQKKRGPKPKEKMIKVEVKQAIGVPASPEFIKNAQIQAQRRGQPFSAEGLTEMVYPAKKYLDRTGKKPEWKMGEPVYVELPFEIAKRLDKAGAVERVWED